jgi:hypothetical protein
MADTKISALPAGAPAVGTDLLPIDRTGTSMSLQVSDVLTGDVHATFSEYTGQSSDPSAPTSATRIYTRPLANRYVPRFIGPAGLDSALQPALFANNVTMWLPGSAAVASISFGITWTVGATQATPAIASTNFMTQMKRATFTTTTTAADAAGIRGASACCWRGNAASQGGFFFAARFGVLTFTSTMRIFCGLDSAGAALAGDPSALANACGMSKDTAETVWQCLTTDNTPTAAKISTGRTVAAAGATDIFDLFMYCFANDTNLWFRVVDMTTNTVLVNNTVQTSNLPANTQMLFPLCYTQNVAGGAGSAVAVFLNKIYVESDT